MSKSREFRYSLRFEKLRKICCGVCVRKIMIFNMCFIHRRYGKMLCLIISNLQPRSDRNPAKIFPN